jgi:cytidylate kinase
VLAEQAIRDERDRSREHSPLEPAPGAVVLDTTGLSQDEVVQRVVELARARERAPANTPDSAPPKPPHHT